MKKTKIQDKKIHQIQKIKVTPQIKKIILNNIKIFKAILFFVEKFKDDVPSYMLRHRMKAGITGWAQVNTGYGVGKAGAEKKLNYDLYYLKHLGIAIDVIVAYRTLATLIRGQGAR